MSGLTEVQHLRAEVARLEAALADATAPRTPPGSFAEQAAAAVARMDRCIEILTAVVDGPFQLAHLRLREIGVDTADRTELGMVSMAMLAAPLLDGQAHHAREHGVDCPQLDPVDMVRSYAQVTANAREHLGGKAGG